MNKLKDDLHHELYLILGSRGSGKTSKLRDYKMDDKRDYLEGLILCPTAGSFTSSYDNFLPDVPRVIAMDEREMSKELGEFLDRAKHDSKKFAKRLKYHEELAHMNESKEKKDFLRKKFPLLRIPHRYLILDDCQGLKITKSPMFLSWLIRHRHSCVDVYIISQSTKGFSPVVRANCSRVSIFPYKGKAILKQLYEEFGPARSMDEKDFAGRMCECDIYQCMTIDYNKKDDKGDTYIKIE
jgi:hypothetical protein